MQSSEREAQNTYAAAAIGSIREHGLQIDPQAFSVWYEYHRGGNAGLRRMLDIILTNRTPITTVAISRIYEKFVANSADYQTIRETSVRMEQTLGVLLGLVRDASEDAHRFGSTVRRVSGQFAAQECSISDLIQSLLAEAKDIGTRTGRIEAELARNAELMSTMQRTLEDARKEATTDALTGLANRRCLDDELQLHAGRAMNDGSDLSLLILDIDHFKRVNDRWGHPVGDQVIRLAAATLRAQIRDTDLAARYGGEEFAVLLPGLAINAAAIVGERIRCAFEAHRVLVRDSGQTLGKITVSVGAARYEPGEPLAHWVARADAALYEAKQGGRNRLVMARQPELAD